MITGEAPVNTQNTKQSEPFLLSLLKGVMFPLWVKGMILGWLLLLLLLLVAYNKRWKREEEYVDEEDLPERNG